MKRTFLDTAYLIALEASDDQFHEKAKNHWHNFLAQKPRLVTTSYIFDEVTTFFNSRDKHEKAVEIGERILQSTSIEFIHVDESLFEAGWKTFQRNNDKQYSLTDCISFEIMEKKGIQTVLSFDHHFEQAGFRKIPQ
jgi:predicted nucleic acid-binding protein